MKVILNADVPELGHIGDLVNVKPGYARNYLLPNKLALEATTRNVKQLEHDRQRVDAKRRKEKMAAEELAKKLEQAQVRIVAKVGEENKLYGSVTTTMIAEQLTAKGFDIDKRKIQLDEPIKSTGVFTVAVKIHADINANVKVWVTAEEEPAAQA